LIGYNMNHVALIYAVTTDDCACRYGTTYSSLTCGCEICRNYLEGSINCTVLTTCLLCDSAANFHLDLSGLCVCSLGSYYTTASDICDPICSDGYVEAHNRATTGT
jgi:hypothetical protein